MLDPEPLVQAPREGGEVSWPCCPVCKQDVEPHRGPHLDGCPWRALEWRVAALEQMCSSQLALVEKLTAHVEMLTSNAERLRKLVFQLDGPHHRSRKDALKRNVPHGAVSIGIDSVHLKVYT